MEQLHLKTLCLKICLQLFCFAYLQFSGVSQKSDAIISQVSTILKDGCIVISPVRISRQANSLYPTPPRLCKHISMTRPRSSSRLRSNKTGGRQKLGAADIAERTKPRDEDPYQPAASAGDDLLLLKGKKESCKVGKSLIKPNKGWEKKCCTTLWKD